MQGCCDGFELVECAGHRACDNEFFYCLIPLGNTPLTNANILNTLPERDITTHADQLGCQQPPVALRSDENRDGGTINFLSNTVLGLLNPLEFEVPADRWQVRKIHKSIKNTTYQGKEISVEVYPARHHMVHVQLRSH